MKTTMMTMKMIGKVFLCMLPVIAFMVWYSSQVNKMMNDPVVEAQMTAQAHCNWQNDPIVDCKALSVN